MENLYLNNFRKEKGAKCCSRCLSAMLLNIIYSGEHLISCRRILSFISSSEEIELLSFGTLAARLSRSASQLSKFKNFCAVISVDIYIPFADYRFSSYLIIVNFTQYSQSKKVDKLFIKINRNYSMPFGFMSGNI